MNLARAVLAVTSTVAVALGGGCDEPGGFDVPGSGGGGGGSTGAADAGPSDAAPPADASALSGIFGTLCVTENLLGTSPCLSGSLADVPVAHVETGATTTASADGTWNLPASTVNPTATLIAADGHPVFRPSMGTFALAGGQAGPIEMTLVPQDHWETLRTSIGASEQPGDAALVVHILSAGVPQSGVVFVPLDGIVQAYYDDGPDGQTWDQEDTGTGAGGTILLYQALPNAGVYDFALSFQGDQLNVRLPARADTITVATLNVAP